MLTNYTSKKQHGHNLQILDNQLNVIDNHLSFDESQKSISHLPFNQLGYLSKDNKCSFVLPFDNSIYSYDVDQKEVISQHQINFGKDDQALRASITTTNDYTNLMNSGLHLFHILMKVLAIL